MTEAQTIEKDAQADYVSLMQDSAEKRTQDLDKDMTEAQTIEKDAQADYVSLMQDSAEKRTQDSKSLTDNEAAKANLEGELEAHRSEKTAAGRELMATAKYISS